MYPILVRAAAAAAGGNPINPAVAAAIATSYSSSGSTIKKSVKSHDKQAKTIDKITKESNDPEDDEEQAEYDKGWYGESLKETASKLGYLKEDRQETIISLDDLTFDMLKQVFSDNYKDVHFIRPQTGEPYYRDAISLPNWDDSSTSIGDTVALNHWKEEMSGHYGNVDILLKPEAENWFDKVEIMDDKYKTAKSKFIKGKMSAMQRDMDAGRSID